MSSLYIYYTTIFLILLYIYLQYFSNSIRHSFLIPLDTAAERVYHRSHISSHSSTHLSIFLPLILFLPLSHAFWNGALTILELSEFVAVFAEPKDLRTVKAAARCLKASVSGPPPATSKSCLSNSIEAYVFPEPLVPVEEVPEICIPEQRKRRERESVGNLTGKDDCLRISGLRLLPHSFLNDLVQLGCQWHCPGAR